VKQARDTGNIALLEGKRIVLGVTGSIAVYKAVDLASKLTQAGAAIDVIMTESAVRFVAPVTFEAVTGRAVHTDLWQASGGELPTHIAHVGLGEGADLLAIVPATANTMAHMAAGIADNLLTVTALAARCPAVVAPAMDGGMYAHAATQANIALLQERGVILIEPDEGRFASGLTGKGRLPETATLLGHIRHILGRSGRLNGHKVVVTAGGTREAIDPVRFLTNHSSGKQGHALAQAAVDAGADVVLISTTDALRVPEGARSILVVTACDMLAAVQEHASNADVLIKAAAVADFRPAKVEKSKIKKSADESEILAIQLQRNPDILQEINAQRERTGWPRVVVGFAAESDDLLNNAKAKLEKKGLDLIVANDITAPDAGFGTDSNRVIILDTSGGQQVVDLASKTAISEIIMDRVADILSHLE
jgi:phosphopantothenoylcysteine decarboxylase/phosphopantothenate--cysteine ligase